MPRPRTVDDSAILDATVALVGRAGPAGVTLSAVGAEVGLSAATIVQRFGTKRGLLLAVAARSAGGLPPGFDAPGPPLRALRDGLHELIAALAPTPEELANHTAFLQLDLADPEFHAHALAGQRLLLRRIGELLAAGGLDAGLARAVVVAFNGALITWAIERSGSAGALLDAQLDLLLQASSATQSLVSRSQKARPAHGP